VVFVVAVAVVGVGFVERVVEGEGAGDLEGYQGHF
jgi:hypothetical protein